MSDLSNTPTYLFLSERFKRTKWPYIGLVETKNAIGQSFYSDIKELKEKGMIKPRKSPNGWLIELVKPEEFLSS